MPHILFVCTANICRSPVAEGILRKRLEEAFMDGWTVSSAGTWALHERGASRNSVLALQERGIDITGHVAQGISEEMIRDADLVLCMEAGHAEALNVEFREEAAGKVYMLSQMVGRHHDIADPYGQDMAEYERMVEEVTQLIDAALPRIMQLASENAQARWGVQ